MDNNLSFDNNNDLELYQLSLEYKKNTDDILNDTFSGLKDPGKFTISMPDFDSPNFSYDNNTDYFVPKQTQNTEQNKKVEDTVGNEMLKFNQLYEKNAQKLNQASPDIALYSNTKAKGSTFGIPYEFDNSPEKKYLTGELGWDPKLSIDENEQEYYKKVWEPKSAFEKAMLTLSRASSNVTVKTGLKFIEGLGFIGAAINPLNFNNRYFLNVANNGLSRLMSDASDQMINSKYFQSFKSKESQNFGFFDKMLTSDFWIQDFSDGAAFMLAALIPVGGEISAGVKALMMSGKLAKTGIAAASLAENLAEGAVVGSRVLGGLQVAGRAGRASEFFFGTKSLAAPIQHAYSVASEAFFETKGVIDDLKKRRAAAKDGSINDPKLANMSEEEFQKYIGNRGANTFGANVALLSFTNLFQTRLAFKLLGKRELGSPNLRVILGGKLASKTEEDILEKGLSKTFKQRVQKRLNSIGAAGKEFSKEMIGDKVSKGISRIGKTAGKLGYKGSVGLAIEGYVEENAQLAFERLNADESTYKYYTPGEAPAKEFIDQYLGQIGNTKWTSSSKGTDIEATSSIGLGGILGGGTSVISSIMQRKKYEKKVDKDDKVTYVKKEYRNIFGKNTEQDREKGKWYSGFFYGEVRNEEDEKNIKALELANLQNIYGRYLDISSLVNSETEDEFNAKRANMIHSLKSLEEKYSLGELFKDPILGNILKQQAFIEYVQAAHKIGYTKDVIKGFTDILKVPIEKIKQMGLDPDSFKDSDVKMYKEIGDILLKSDKEIKDVGFSSGILTFDALDILSQHRRNNIKNDRLHAFIYDNAIEEFNNKIGYSIDEYAKDFKDDQKLELKELLDYAKEISNLYTGLEVLLQEFFENKEFLTEEEIKNLKKEIKDKSKEIKEFHNRTNTDKAELLSTIGKYNNQKRKINDVAFAMFNELYSQYSTYILAMKDHVIIKEEDLDVAPIGEESKIEKHAIASISINAAPFFKDLKGFIESYYATTKTKNSIERLSKKTKERFNLLNSLDADGYIEWFKSEKAKVDRINTKKLEESVEKEAKEKAKLQPQNPETPQNPEDSTNNSNPFNSLAALQAGQDTGKDTFITPLLDAYIDSLSTEDEKEKVRVFKRRFFESIKFGQSEIYKKLLGLEEFESLEQLESISNSFVNIADNIFADLYFEFYNKEGNIDFNQYSKEYFNIYDIIYDEIVDILSKEEERLKTPVEEQTGTPENISQPTLQERKDSDKDLNDIKYRLDQLEDQLKQKIEALINNGADPATAKEIALKEQSKEDAIAILILKKQYLLREKEIELKVPNADINRVTSKFDPLISLIDSEIKNLESTPSIPEENVSDELKQIAAKLEAFMSSAEQNGTTILDEERDEDARVVVNSLDNFVNDNKASGEKIPFLSEKLNEVHEDPNNPGFFRISSANEAWQASNPDHILAARNFLKNLSTNLNNYKIKLSVNQSGNIIGTVVGIFGEETLFDKNGEEGGNIPVTFRIDDSFFSKGFIFKSRQESTNRSPTILTNVRNNNIVDFQNKLKENFNEDFLNDLKDAIKNDEDFPLLTIEGLTKGVLFRDGYQNNRTILDEDEKKNVKYRTLSELQEQDSVLFGKDINISIEWSSENGRMLISLSSEAIQEGLKTQMKPVPVKDFNTKDGLIRLYDITTSNSIETNMDQIISQLIGGVLPNKFLDLINLVVDLSKYIIIPTDSGNIGILSKDIIFEKFSKGLDEFQIIEQFRNKTLLTTREQAKLKDGLMDYPVVFDKVYVENFQKKSELGIFIFVNENNERLSFEDILKNNIKTSIIPIKIDNKFTYDRVNQRMMLSLPIKAEEFKKRKC